MVIESTSKDGLHDVHFDEEAHLYELDGKPVPGVTTFIKAGWPESPYLTGWKIGEGAKYAIQELIAASRRLDPLTEELIDGIVKRSKNAYLVSSRAAASVGTVVHDYAYANENGQEFDEKKILEHPNAVKVLACIAKFKEWKEFNRDTIVACEAVVGSSRYSYGGKFDRLATRNGLLVLSDFKTSSGIFGDFWLQLAAYKIAIEEWIGKTVDALEIIRFGKTDGAFETKLIDDKDQIREFEMQTLRNRETYEFRKQHDDL